MVFALTCRNLLPAVIVAGRVNVLPTAVFVIVKFCDAALICRFVPNLEFATNRVVPPERTSDAIYEFIMYNVVEAMVAAPLSIVVLFIVVNVPEETARLAVFHVIPDNENVAPVTVNVFADIEERITLIFDKNRFPLTVMFSMLNAGPLVTVFDADIEPLI